MYIIYARFSVFLAVSVTCLGLASEGFSFTYRGKNYHPIISIAKAETVKTNSALNSSSPRDRENQVKSSALPSNSTSESLNYQNYMQAGYTADQNKDYLTALANFKNALALRPEDSLAKKAIHNVTSYAFDSLMQAGYKADKLRDYQAALKYFRQANDLKPNSFYARQAIHNISTYLATTDSANAEANAESDDSSEDSPVSSWLLFVALSLALSVAGGILYLLFSGNNKARELTEETVPNPEKEDEIETDLPANPTYAEVKPPPPNPEPQIIATTNHNVVEGEQKTQIFTTETNGSQLKPIEQPTLSQTPSYLTSSSPSQITKLDIVPELIEDLQQRDRNLRRKSIWELAQRGDSRAMKPLVELMVKVDSQERSLILEAMTQIASRTLKPMNKALSLSLEDVNSQVRQNAIRDLTRVYELMSQVTQRLSQAVDDSDEEVQETAKWALKQLNQMPNNTWNNHNDF